MALVIENEELLRLAAAEAANRGITVSELVEETLRSALEESSRHAAAKAKADDMIAWVRKLNEGRPKDDTVTSDHSWLYDENGLPH
jgi:hypothetical protein